MIDPASDAGELKRLVTNLDVNLTPAQRRYQERVERESQLIDDSVKRAEKGAGADSKVHYAQGTAMTVTDAQIADKTAFTANSRGCLRPRYIADRTTGEIIAKAYTKAEFEALESGNYCVRCDELQRFAVPSFAAADAVCDLMSGGRSCGFPRDRESWRKLPFEILKLPDRAEAHAYKNPTPPQE